MLTDLAFELVAWNLKHKHTHTHTHTHTHAHTNIIVLFQPYGQICLTDEPFRLAGWTRLYHHWQLIDYDANRGHAARPRSVTFVPYNVALCCDNAPPPCSTANTPRSVLIAPYKSLSNENLNYRRITAAQQMLK